MNDCDAKKVKQQRLLHNMKKLPRDMKEKIERRYLDLPPEKIKELQYKSRVRRFLASTEINAKALEDMRKQIELDENMPLCGPTQVQTRGLPVYDADILYPSNYREPHQKPKKIAYKANKPTYWDQIY